MIQMNYYLVWLIVLFGRVEVLFDRIGELFNRVDVLFGIVETLFSRFISISCYM